MDCPPTAQPPHQPAAAVKPPARTADIGPDVPPTNNNTPVAAQYDFWQRRAMLNWPQPATQGCFTSYLKRLDSFKGRWPEDKTVPTAEKLAEAGFYYDGTYTRYILSFFLSLTATALTYVTIQDATNVFLFF
jgi:hypothetical protein